MAENNASFGRYGYNSVYEDGTPLYAFIRPSGFKNWSLTVYIGKRIFDEFPVVYDAHFAQEARAFETLRDKFGSVSWEKAVFTNQTIDERIAELRGREMFGGAYVDKAVQNV